jgi:DNA-binding NarL/FixJ family response regulator
MRVLVADADPDVRAALSLLLSREPQLRVVGHATDVGGLVTSAAIVQPDLVLLDWDLPGMQAGEAVTQLRRACSSPPAIVVLSVRPERRPDVLALGIELFVSKGEPPDRLLVAIRTAKAARRPGHFPRF